MSTLNEKNTILQDWRIESTMSHLGNPQPATLCFVSSILADLHAYLHSIHELFHLEHTFQLGQILSFHSFVEMASAAFFG